MEQRAKTATELGNTRAKAVAEVIVRELLLHTPVDTSKAVSNWQVGLGTPVGREIPAYVPGKKGSTRQASVSEALAYAQFRIAQKRAGEPLYISNLVDYIGDLNAGSSRQAPAGFVERALLVGRNTETAGVRMV